MLLQYFPYSFFPCPFRDMKNSHIVGIKRLGVDVNLPLAVKRDTGVPSSLTGAGLIVVAGLVAHDAPLVSDFLEIHSNFV